MPTHHTNQMLTLVIHNILCNVRVMTQGIYATIFQRDCLLKCQWALEQQIGAKQELALSSSIVVGRRSVDTRICTGPKWDRETEEQKLSMQEENARRIASRVTETTIVIKPPPGKKRKLDSQVIMMPVHVNNFEKLNEFAEAAWILRDPGNTGEIKDLERSY